MNRKTVLVLILLVGLSSLSLPAIECTDAQTSSAAWPMFRADASHTGSATGNTLVTPNQLWSYSTSNRPVASENSPAISNGILYVGSADGNLYALDATSGTKLWNYSTGNTIDSSPAVYNGIVYVGALGFYALNATNGEKIWNSSSDYIVSSPTIVNGVVYFAGSHTVYALNAENGMMLWNNSVSSSNWQIVSSPAVANGIVYIGSDDHNLYALNATDGSQLWVYPTSSYVESSPTIANGIAYVISDDENLYALNTTNGEKLWSYSGTYDTVNGESVAVVNNVVYVLSDNNGPHTFGAFLKALNAETGVQLWSSSTTDCEPFPIVVGAVLYIGGINNLFVFNATDGSWLWNSTQTGEILSSPAYANGVVYVDSIKGNIYAFGTPAAQPTFSPTLNVPEFPAFAIVPLLLSVFSIALVLRHRKKLSYQ